MEPLDIARLEERRQAIGTAEVALESAAVGGGIMAYAGPGSWANQACGLGLDGPVSADDLERLVAFYVERGVEPKLEVCAFAHESLLEGLAARGFVLREFEDVLARPLAPGEDLAACLPHPPPADLALRHVDPGDAAQVTEYVEVSTAGFVRPGESPAPLHEVCARVVRHPRSDSFLAVLGQAAAGGGGMETAGEVACLFGASVAEPYRRRGIQAALMVRRLERARELGARVGVIHSSPGIATARNARRLGFALAYTKVVLARPGPGLLRSP